MKKLIAMLSVAVVLTGCSGSFNINTNPNEVDFDENYQGSPDIDLDNAGMTDEEVVEEEEVMTEETGSGETAMEEEVDAGTGETVVEEVVETGTGEVAEEETMEEAEAPAEEAAMEAETTEEAQE